MRYPVAIEPGGNHQAYGVVVPDLPGCLSAGDSLDDALSKAEEAVIAWIDATLDAGQPIPRSTAIDALRTQHPEWADRVWAIVQVDPARLDDKIERVNITLPRRVLAILDAAAREAGETRSGYIARLALSWPRVGAQGRRG